MTESKTKTKTTETLGLVFGKRFPPKLDDIGRREENFDFLVSNGLLMPQLPWDETQRDVLRQRIKDNEQTEKGRTIREELLSVIAFRNKRLELLCGNLVDDETFTDLQEKLFSQIFAKFSLYSQDGRRRPFHPFENQSLTKAEKDKMFRPQKARFLEELEDIMDLERHENRLLLVKLYKSTHKELIEEWSLREYKNTDLQSKSKPKFYDFWSLKSIQAFTSIYFLSEEEKKKLPSTNFISTANVLRLAHSWKIREESKILLEATLKKSGVLNQDFWPKLDF